MVVEASGVKASVAESTIYLVVSWDRTDTSSFLEIGPRDEMAMMLERLADDIVAKVAMPQTQDQMVIVDTNGQSVGSAVFTSTPPAAPMDGHPLLIVPVMDLDGAAMVLTDVCMKLQSSIEDIYLPSQVDDERLVHFYWRDLPTLEWHRYQQEGWTWDAIQTEHERVQQMILAQDQTNPHARFVLAYERIDRIAESLDLQARLEGFGDSARVGYFKNRQWTGIASEITMNGKVLTTVNAQRADGSGYTADGEWQREQLQSALTRLPHVFNPAYGREARPEAADVAEPEAF